MATENDLDPIDELARQQREIEEKARTEAAKLEGERARLIEQRRPLNELQQKRLELAEKIERVKRARPRVEEYAAEFRQIVDRYLSSDSLEIIDFSHMITSWPHLANAKASQLTNDADLGAHLAKLESDMKLGFSYRLP